MDLSRLTSKGQVTIPRRVREAAGLAEGDVVIFTLKPGAVTLRKLRPASDSYLSGIEESLGEWLEAEDEDAWRDL